MRYTLGWRASGSASTRTGYPPPRPDWEGRDSQEDSCSLRLDDDVLPVVVFDTNQGGFAQLARLRELRLPCTADQRRGPSRAPVLACNDSVAWRCDPARAIRLTAPMSTVRNRAAPAGTTLVGKRRARTTPARRGRRADRGKAGWPARSLRPRRGRRTRVGIAAPGPSRSPSPCSLSPQACSPCWHWSSRISRSTWPWNRPSRPLAPRGWTP